MPAHQKWVTTAITEDLVRGALELETTVRGVLPHRLPARARAQYFDPQLAMAESQPSGVRIVFRTAATSIELDTFPTRRTYLGMPARPSGVYDLMIDGRLVSQASATGGDTLVIDMSTGTGSTVTGVVTTVRFTEQSNAMKEVEIWLPHNEMTELICLRTDTPIELTARASLKRWLHHGSSISQGSDAASPTQTWPATAASLAGANLINLGFGGSALLDPFVARAIRDTAADLITVKIGINLVNTDLMRRRAFTPSVHGFLDTIRDGHPTTPLLVISPIFCPIHEDTPGPTAFDPIAFSTGQIRFQATGDPTERAAGKLTLSVIRDELARIVEQRAVEDPHIDYVDGRDLYGEADYDELPLPDELHPSTEAHRRIGQCFAELAFGGRGALGGGRASADIQD